MPIPLIPIALLFGGAAAGGVAGRIAGRAKENRLEEALATVAAATPEAKLPPAVEAALSADQKERIRARAVGIRTGIAEKAVAKGIEKQAELLPTPSERKLAMQGLVTPMTRLGGWR